MKARGWLLGLGGALLLVALGYATAWYSARPSGNPSGTPDTTIAIADGGRW